MRPAVGRLREEDGAPVVSGEWPMEEALRRASSVPSSAVRSIFVDSSIPVPLVPVELLPRGELDLRDELLMFFIDGERSIGEIARAAALTSADLEASLRRLELHGLVALGVLR